MRYWDSSALVPLFVEQVASARMRQIATEDPSVVTGWTTPVECVSGFSRLERDGRLSPGAVGDALALLRRAAETWTEVPALPDVREQAIRLIRVHQLRAGDALQLAAAVIAADFQPRTLELVTLDSRLGEAASKEGFPVIG